MNFFGPHRPERVLLRRNTLYTCTCTLHRHVAPCTLHLHWHLHYTLLGGRAWRTPLATTCPTSECPFSSRPARLFVPLQIFYLDRPWTEKKSTTNFQVLCVRQLSPWVCWSHYREGCVVKTYWRRDRHSTSTGLRVCQLCCNADQIRCLNRAHSNVRNDASPSCPHILVGIAGLRTMPSRLQRHNGLCENVACAHRQVALWVSLLAALSVSRIWPQTSEQALMTAFSRYPVSIAIKADQSSFQWYKTGVLTRRWNGVPLSSYSWQVCCAHSKLTNDAGDEEVTGHGPGIRRMFSMAPAGVIP